MAAIDELSTFTAPEDPYRTVGDNDISLSDYARQLAAGAYGVAGGLAGAAEYALRIPSGTDLERIRDWSEEGAKSQRRQMSPGAQRNLDATFLPGEGPTIFDKDVSTSHAMGLRLAGAVPSMLASIIPGGMMARVAGATAGTLAGGAVSAAQTAGDTYNNIVGTFRDTPDDQLREESPAYQGFRNMGMSEREARERLVETVTSYKPALMGAITLATSRYGVEGLAAQRFAGEAGTGVLRQSRYWLRWRGHAGSHRECLPAGAAAAGWLRSARRSGRVRLGQDPRRGGQRCSHRRLYRCGRRGSDCRTGRRSGGDARPATRSSAREPEEEADSGRRYANPVSSAQSTDRSPGRDADQRSWRSRSHRRRADQPGQGRRGDAARHRPEATRDTMAASTSSRLVRRQR